METHSKPSPAEHEAGMPYTDVKPVGAADFYTAVNATFRFIQGKLGREGLLRYWADLGKGYYEPVTRRWQAGGLQAVAAYWQAFFAAEPGAVVAVAEAEGEVTVEVKICPAIKFLREHGREIVPCFCQHCYYVSTAMAAGAGMEMRLAGGNGSCKQRFAKKRPFLGSPV